MPDKMVAHFFGLNPCPRCGAAQEFVKFFTHDHKNYVWCSKCKARTATILWHSKKAVAAWQNGELMEVNS